MRFLKHIEISPIKLPDLNFVAKFIGDIFDYFIPYLYRYWLSAFSTLYQSLFSVPPDMAHSLNFG